MRDRRRGLTCLLGLALLAATACSSNKNATPPPVPTSAGILSGITTVTATPGAIGSPGANGSVTPGAAGSATPGVTGSATATGTNTAGTPAASAPGATTSQTPAAGGTVAAGSTYTVKAGDSLGTIAQSAGVSVQALASANNITNPDNITIGQQLKIPAAGAAAATSTAARPATPAAGSTAASGAAPTGTAASAGGGQNYTVQPGDTACGIAAVYKLSLDQLATANGTTASALNDIRPGQVLKIPTSNGSTGGCP